MQYAVSGCSGPNTRSAEAVASSTRYRAVPNSRRACRSAPRLLITTGLTNRQIAQALVITERTVAGHIEHILNKLELSLRTQIGVWAAEHRMIASSGA